MDKQSYTQNTVLDSRQALNLYLESLFREPETTEPEQNFQHIYTEPFEVMLIKFGKHQLAIPVMEIKNIINIHDKPLIQLPEQAGYQFGITPYQGDSVPVVDMGWMFNFLGKLKRPKDTVDINDIRYAVLLAGEPLALGCAEAEQIHRISPDDVKWNQSSKRYPWRSGLLREQMTVLLNIQQVKRLFIQAIKQSGLRAGSNRLA